MVTTNDKELAESIAIILRGPRQPRAICVHEAIGINSRLTRRPPSLLGKVKTARSMGGSVAGMPRDITSCSPTRN